VALPSNPHVNEAERRFRKRSARGQMDLLDMWDKQREKIAHDALETTETQAGKLAEGNQGGIDEICDASKGAPNDERPRSCERRTLGSHVQASALEEKEMKRDQWDNQSNPPTQQHGVAPTSNHTRCRRRTNKRRVRKRRQKQNRKEGEQQIKPYQQRKQ
jgi:hypothetical protein